VTAVSVPRIEARIQTVRALRVMVDADLAEIYGVPTKRLNEQVKRNGRRFPADFMFQLTTAEKAEVVANCDHLQKLKFSKALPFAFKRSPLLVPTTGLRAPKPSLGDALPSKEGPLHRSRVPERAARCWPGRSDAATVLGSRVPWRLLEEQKDRLQITLFQSIVNPVSRGWVYNSF